MFDNFFHFVVVVNSGWQSLAPSSAVADYLSHLPASTLPLSLHHFLKYSAESIKKESQNQLSVNDVTFQNLIGMFFFCIIMHFFYFVL